MPLLAGLRRRTIRTSRKSGNQGLSTRRCFSVRPQPKPMRMTSTHQSGVAPAQIPREAPSARPLRQAVREQGRPRSVIHRVGYRWLRAQSGPCSLSQGLHEALYAIKVTWFRARVLRVASTTSQRDNEGESRLLVCPKKRPSMHHPVSVPRLRRSPARVNLGARIPSFRSLRRNKSFRNCSARRQGHSLTLR